MTKARLQPTSSRGDEIRHNVKEYNSKGGVRGILNYGSVNTDEFKWRRWDKIDAAILSPDASAV